MTASGGTSYQWTANEDITDLTASNQTVSPTALTTYSVLGTDENGCTNTAEVMINVNPNPTASAGEDQNTCGGIAVDLTASGGSTYEWSNNVSDAITL